MDALTPRRSRRNSFCSRSHNKDDKNPYSTRGLDKFSALLAELEEKKQKIYSQRGSEDISLVRFVYKGSDDYVPIVVKVKKDKTKSGEIKEEPAEHNSQVLDKFPVDSAAEKEAKLSGSDSENTMNKLKKSLSFSNIKLNNLRRPSFYLPAAIILILLFLVFFGRSFAILCTSIGWYIVPQLQGSKSSSSNVRRSMKKKDYVRRLSEKKIVTIHELSSPKPRSSNSNNSGAVKVQSPEVGAHGHRKSW